MVRRVVKRVRQARVSYHSGKPHEDPELVSAPFGKEDGHAQEDDERDDHRLGGLVQGAGGDVVEVSPVVIQGLGAPEKGLNPFRTVSGGPMVTVWKTETGGGERGVLRMMRS